jgi:hypothetical protein
MLSFLMAEKNSVMYMTHFLAPLISCRASGLFP